MQQYKKEKLPCDIDLGGVIYEKGSSLMPFLIKVDLYRKVAQQKQEKADSLQKTVSSMACLLAKLEKKGWWQSNTSIMKKHYQDQIDAVSSQFEMD